MDHVTYEDKVMQEEIFGPVMPVLTYNSLDELIGKINSMPHPLALYFFTRDKVAARKVTSQCQFGGGCINDTIIHLATSENAFWGDLVKVVWVVIMAVKASGLSPIIRVSWTKKIMAGSANEIPTI